MPVIFILELDKKDWIESISNICSLARALSLFHGDNKINLLSKVTIVRVFNTLIIVRIIQCAEIRFLCHFFSLCHIGATINGDGRRFINAQERKKWFY